MGFGVDSKNNLLYLLPHLRDSSHSDMVDLQNEIQSMDCLLPIAVKYFK